MPDTSQHPIAQEQVEELIDFYLHWASHEFGAGWTLVDDTAYQTSRWLLEQLIARMGNQGLVGIDVELFDPSVACAVHPQYARLTVDQRALQWGQWLGELHWHTDGQLGGDLGPGLERLLVLVSLFGGAVRAFPTTPAGDPFEAVGWQVTDFVATAIADASTGTFLEERQDRVLPPLPHRDDRSLARSGGSPAVTAARNRARAELAAAASRRGRTPAELTDVWASFGRWVPPERSPRKAIEELEAIFAPDAHPGGAPHAVHVLWAEAGGNGPLSWYPVHAVDVVQVEAAPGSGCPVLRVVRPDGAFAEIGLTDIAEITAMTPGDDTLP